MNVKQAKSLAFGSKASASLEEYYAAWQWLYDHEVELKQPDVNYLDKLICDGVVQAKEDYFIDKIDE